MSSGTQTQKGLAGCCLGLLLFVSPAAYGQTIRGPRDYVSTDRYGHAYRDTVFGDDPYHEDRSLRRQAAREDRSSRYDRQRVRIEEDRLADQSSYSDVYPFSPRGQRVAPPREERRPPAYADPYTLPKKRYRDGVIRNDYAGAPVYRHFYGGVDRYDSPGYLDDAGRASALSNGYVRRGVAEFSGQGYAGVRPNDVYPLNRDVNPRRYRGRFLNGEVAYDDQDTSGANELEDFIRSELSVRPGANLRVSSTGTWTFRNYLDAGNQVHARFRIPVHRAFGYGRTP
ncbi:MAG TPA: hypothetical protein VF278_20600 [Pirellulales bacterium]